MFLGLFSVLKVWFLVFVVFGYVFSVLSGACRTYLGCGEVTRERE